MPWYKVGTVSVAQNSNTVNGTGTSFIANARVGDAFRGPDGGWYEVTNIVSNTAMSISPAYQGATASSGAYALAPMQGYIKDSADALRALANEFGSVMAVLGTTGTLAGVRTALNLSDTGGLPEGTNKYYTDARARQASLAGLNTSDATAVVAADSILGAVGKLQAQSVGKAGKGANSDITSLSGLTTALSIAQGGTGGNSKAAARVSLGIDDVQPVEKGGTGGNTQASARTGLGLGTAAVANIGTSAGNVQSISAPAAMVGNSAFAEQGSHFIAYGDSTTVIPSGGQYWVGIRAQYPYQNCAMDLVAQVVTGGSLNLMFRTVAAGGGGDPWRKIYHDGNTTKAADGTLKAI